MWVMVRPSGERIKVRGDKYFADCRLLIADWKKIGFLLEFTPDLFRCRNDKIKQRCKQEMSFPSLISQG